MSKNKDEELEKTVLAYLVRDTRFMVLAEIVLKQEFFAFEKTKRIFGAMGRVYTKWNTCLDYEIFEKKILKTAKLSPEEELEYLNTFKEIEQWNIDETKFAYYVDELKNLKIKRDIDQLYEDLGKNIENETIEGQTLLNEIGEKLHEIRIESNLIEVKRGFVYDNVRERIKTYESRKEKGDISDIPFGWKKLDEHTGGHYHQDLTVIFSRTGGGKTRALHNFAYNATTAKFKALYITIEMSGQEISRLYDSRLCKLHYDKIKKGKLDEEEEAKWRSILKMMERNEADRKGFYIVDMPQGCTTSAVEQEIDDYERRYGKLDCLFIDYLTLMQPVKRTRVRSDDVGEMAVKLKSMARSRDISIVTATQANREVLKIEDGSQVGTEHIGISDQIAQNSNVVIYLYRTPEDKMKNTIKVNLVKCRDGGGIWFELFADWRKNYIGDEVYNLKSE